MSHGSARTTLHGRRLVVQRHRAGWPQAQIAAAMGVSRTCVKTWLDRYAVEGEAGLGDRSSRPHRTPTRTSAEVEARVVDLRRCERRGPDWIGAELGVPARTVSRILCRHHVPWLAVLDPITGEVIRASKVTAVRYERARPGELVHMDVKKLGRILDGGGWKAHGRGAASITRDRNTKVGFDYVHSLVDDHSRLGYCEVLADEKGETCAAFLARAAAYFAVHEIVRIEEVMIDNARAPPVVATRRRGRTGRPSDLHQGALSLQNGKVERLNRTLLTEWAYRQVFTSNEERATALAPLEHYNNQRRHSALGGLPPISRLLPT